MTATKKVTENVVKKEAVKKEVEVDEPTKGDYTYPEDFIQFGWNLRQNGSKLIATRGALKYEGSPYEIVPKLKRWLTDYTLEQKYGSKDSKTKDDYGIQSVIKFVNGTFKTEFFTDKTVDDVKAEILARDIYWKMILILDIKNDRVIEIVNSDKKTGKKASTDTNVIRVKNMTEAQRKGIIEEYDKVWKVIGEGILEANKTAKAPALSKEEVINLVLDAFNEHASEEMKELFSKMTPKGRLIIGAKAFTKKSYS